MTATTLDDLDRFAGEKVDAETGEIELLPDQPTNRHPLKMPPEVARAIIEVKGQVKSLPKLEKNDFGKYPYVSVDAFYAAIGPLMAAAGLLLVTDETEVLTIERKNSTWLRIRYELMLYHQSGAGHGPIHRVMLVQATGAQAFGAALSYVEKYYLRGIFRVPTGEQDVDADKPEELPATRPARHAGAFSKNQPPPEPIPPPAPKAEQPTALAEKVKKRLAPEIKEAVAEQALDTEAWDKAAEGWDTFKDWFNKLPQDSRIFLEPALEELKEKAFAVSRAAKAEAQKAQAPRWDSR